MNGQSSFDFCPTFERMKKNQITFLTFYNKNILQNELLIRPGLGLSVEVHVLANIEDLSQAPCPVRYHRLCSCITQNPCNQLKLKE